MISELDREIQVHRMQGLLSAADRIAWSRPSFPGEHRPDVAALSPKIGIGTNVAQELEPHPQMRPEVLEYFQKSAARARAVSNKVAWYDFSTREMILNPLLVGGPDDEVLKVIYHEAATDISNRASVVLPSQFSPDEIVRVREVLQAAFPPGAAPSIDEASITRSGFKKYIIVGEFLISMFYPAEIENFDEVYPTVHEMVTDQIVRRGGDVEYFDSDAKSGQLRTVGFESHQSFAGMLFRVLTVIDWRDLLSAFKTGDFHDTLAVLEKTAYNKDYGAGILAELFTAMKEDEELIERVNRLSGRSFSDFGLHA